MANASTSSLSPPAAYKSDQRLSFPSSAATTSNSSPLVAASFLQSAFFSEENADAVFTPFSPPVAVGSAVKNGKSRSYTSSTPIYGVSVLNDSTETSKKESNADEQKRQVAEALIAENPYDASAWDTLLSLKHTSSDTYERVLEYFPTNPRYWKLYAEHKVKENEFDDARSIYKRCVNACGEIALWKSYIKYLYHTGTAYDVVQALLDAVEKVGMDFRSGILWKELLILNIKMYNTGILQQGSAIGLLNDPFSMAGVGASTGVPMLPSSFEQECFSQILPNSDDTFVNVYAEITRMRKFFQEWLSSATEFMDIAWIAYCNFERSVAGKVSVAAKFISEYEPHYLLAKETYKELTRLFENLDVAAPAIPVTRHNLSFVKPHVMQWKEILEYEMSNPLKLSVTLLQKRVKFYYQTCLLSCAFHADIWCDYFQVLLSYKQAAKALDVLHMAIERFLPEDELLKLVLCHYLEEIHQIEAAHEVYQNMLQLHPKQTTASFSYSESSANGMQLMGSPVALINYLAFIRRNEGFHAWRKAFDELCSLPSCTWEVYVYQALSEWRCAFDHSGAIRIFKLAMQYFNLESKFIAAYADFLMDTGNREGARGILSRGLSEIHSETSTCNRFLWNKWIRLEHRFGDKASLRFVQDLKNKHISGIPISDALLPSDRNGFATEDISFTIAESLNSGAIKPPHPSHYTDAEVAVLTNSYTNNKSLDYMDILNAKVDLKRWQFAGGEPTTELYERFSFANLHPKTSMIDIFTEESERLKASSSQVIESTLEMDRVKAETGIEEDEEEDAAPLFKDAKPRSRTHSGIMVVRPDVTRMLSFKPVVGAVISKFNESDAILNKPLLSPSKAICDFMHILPKSKSRNESPSLISYLISSLQSISLPPIALNEFSPIPVQQLLALREVEKRHLSTKRPLEGRAAKGTTGRWAKKCEVASDSNEKDEQEETFNSPNISQQHASEYLETTHKLKQRKPNPSNFFSHSKRNVLQRQLAASHPE